MNPKTKINIKLIVSFLLSVSLAWPLADLIVPETFTVEAAASGQMTLYLHRENADINSAYNAMTLTPPSPSTLTTSSDVTVRVTPAAPCKAAQVTGNMINSIVVDDDGGGPGVGDVCLTTFYSMPVGQAISIETSDISSLYGEMYGSNTPGDNANTNFIMRLYKYDGDTYTQFGTVTLGDLGVGVSNQKLTASATPSASVVFNPGDRIVMVLSLNIISTDTSGGADVTRVEFGSTITPSFVRLSYTAVTPEKPDLSGPKDDDFTAPLAQTNCSNSGVNYNTKWTCTTPSGTTLGTVDADSSSQWLILRDKEGGSLGSNFGANPANTYIYQSTDTNADGNGLITTVVNSTINAENGADPHFHSGLLLWASNTDYLILQATFEGNTRGVAINNSGTISNNIAVSGYNRMWLRWAKTGTNYQALVSTNGIEWTEVGGPIAHPATFTRMGLTAYAAAVNTEYAGAFEWFDYDFGIELSQSAYRWFENNDSTDVGLALADQDTPAVMGGQGSAFRLRLLIHVDVVPLVINGGRFKLQVAARSGTCDLGFAGETYADVTVSSGPIRFYDNPTPADGAALAANPEDPFHGLHPIINQTYEEANNFRNSQGAIPAGGDGKWDFSLVNFSAPSGAAYCFRVVRADGTLLENYEQIPEILAPSSTFEQSAYRFFYNLDNKENPNVGSPISAANTLADATPANARVRLRLLLHVGNNALGLNGQEFKLQFVERGSGGTCADPQGSSPAAYTDVASNTVIAFHDWETLADGHPLTNNSNDPTHNGHTVVSQTYEDAGTFTNSINPILAGQDGKWDFSLVGNGVTLGSVYCFRVVRADGLLLDAYSHYPQLRFVSSGGGSSGPPGGGSGGGGGQAGGGQGSGDDGSDGSGGGTGQTGGGSGGGGGGGEAP